MLQTSYFWNPSISTVCTFFFIVKKQTFEKHSAVVLNVIDLGLTFCIFERETRLERPDTTEGCTPFSELACQSNKEHESPKQKRMIILGRQTSLQMPLGLNGIPIFVFPTMQLLPRVFVLPFVVLPLKFPRSTLPCKYSF